MSGRRIRQDPGQVLLPFVPVAACQSPEERRERAVDTRQVLEEGEAFPAGILPEKVADWPEVWRENWEERSAIVEFEGGLPRAAAERLAEERVRLECARPRVVPGGDSP